MNKGHLSVLLFAIVMAVLTVSGCSSNNNVSPTPAIQPCPTPTVTPLPTVNPTAVPSATPAASGTQVPADVANSTNASVTPTVQPVISPTPTPGPTQNNTTLTSLGQLYNTGGLHSYEYRATEATSYNTTVVPFRITYSDDTYEGIPAEHVSVICDSPNSGGAIQIYSDAYLSKANNSMLYGHWKAVSGGQIIMEEDIPAGREGLADIDIARAGDLYGNSPLTGAGTETITINDRTYDCTKYTYDRNGTTCTVWYNPQAPMPVKIQWTDYGTSNTCEVLDWR